LDRLEADVAGVRVAVSGPKAWLDRTLAPRYRRFPAGAPGAVAAVQVTVVDHGPGCPADSPEADRAMRQAPFVDGLPDYPLLVDRAGARLDVTSLHLKGWIDLDAGRGEGLCCTHDSGAAENFLRVAVARLLLPQGGFLLHACAAVSGGEAIVGFGPSGAGKSTLVSLAGDRPVLSDDLVVLRRDASGMLRAIPTLFRDGGAPPSREGYRVKKLYRLRKGPFAIRPLAEKDGARELLGAMPYLVDDPECAAGALMLAADAAANPGCAELTFPKDASVWTALEASS
jgi:hypothetical protein